MADGKENSFFSGALYALDKVFDLAQTTHFVIHRILGSKKNAASTRKSTL